MLAWEQKDCGINAEERFAMKLLSLLFYVMGIGFCIAGFFGHSQAYSDAALSFFAAIVLTVRQARKDKNSK